MNEEPEASADRRQRRPILRVRTGCLTCRARKKKCDEAKPTCMGCRRNKLQCEWPTTSKNKKRKSNDCKEQPRCQTRSQPEPPGPASPLSNSPQTSGEQPQDSRTAHRDTDSIRVGTSPVETVVSAELSPRTAADVDNDPAEPRQSTQTKGMSQEPGCSTDVSSTSSGSCISGSPPNAEISYETLPFGFPTELLDLDLDFDHVPADIPDNEPITDTAPLALNELALSVGGQNALIPRSMPLFPGEGGQSYELLAHYLSRTALSMGNGSTVVNPFISQLIPLAFANQFILDLVICQSAVHRATENATQQAVAQKYYNSSLRQFRKSIDEYINGQEMSPLWIALGALIMCFTETAKGDVHGVVFDHMEAAGPLVSNLVSRTEALPGGLRSFIVEYYVDVATISMISIDPNFGSAPYLSHQFEELANQMVSDGYIGQLCGCWLELLLLLPQIFEFSKHSSAPTPDDFITFSGLQSRITSFKPSAAIGADVALSGHIFREATHIYLLTAASIPNAPSGKVKRMVNDSVAKAFSYLEQLSPNSRINTSLCWALAVIGSCVDDENQQRELRDRLGLMFIAIGLGNIRATSALLDKLWMLPIHERGPWTICRVMHDHEMWISFV